jgi:hypothetical protein
VADAAAVSVETAALVAAAVGVAGAETLVVRGEGLAVAEEEVLVVEADPMAEVVTEEVARVGGVSIAGAIGLGAPPEVEITAAPVEVTGITSPAEARIPTIGADRP